MKKVWKFARDSGLRWWLMFLAAMLGLIWMPFAFILLGSSVMIILIDTGERFYTGIKGLEP